MCPCWGFLALPRGRIFTVLYAVCAHLHTCGVVVAAILATIVSWRGLLACSRLEWRWGVVSYG